MTYLITFACYGCRLHGEESGSVDPEHNRPGSAVLEKYPARVAAERERMDQDPYHLDRQRRDVVLEAIHEVCSYRGWTLLAAHVRSNHLHAVVEAEDPPEKVMNDFKVYSSRGLNRSGLDEVGRKQWARHGSTRWLWKPQQVSAAVSYVVSEQGGTMSAFEEE